ncbi:deoxynucleoside kinase-like isoform X3 [Panulirus ornatus]|uniref:deoxynucleoside kinase-like isoform X3 n=1 Tax=Panulirus ornatus TaxID=150431 RepID=UPI003A86369B
MMRTQPCCKVMLSSLYVFMERLVGSVWRWVDPHTRQRMCSNRLTESSMKLLTAEESSVEFHGGCSLLESTARNLFPSSSCLASAKNKLEGAATASPLKTGLSFLPAALLMQKNFEGIVSKGSSKKEKVRPFTVSIEGNIGSGKSTFLQYFSSVPGVATYQEPVHLWTNFEGHNLLGKLYEDPERWSFLFQSYVQLTRLNIHLQQSSSPVRLIERSLQNNRYCFVESGHDCGHLKGAEYRVLCEYYDFIESKLDIGLDLIVYLRSTPEVVHRRMLKRGRSEEAGVTVEYLKLVHDYYEKWLFHHQPHAPLAPVLIINADQKLEDIRNEYDQKKSVILGIQHLQSSRQL